MSAKHVPGALCIVVGTEPGINDGKIVELIKQGNGAIDHGWIFLLDGDGWLVRGKEIKGHTLTTGRINIMDIGAFETRYLKVISGPSIDTEEPNSNRLKEVA